MSQNTELNPVQTQIKEIAPEHLSPDMFTGLGRAVVESQLLMAAYQVNGQVGTAEIIEPFRHSDIVSTRQWLSGLSPEARREANELFAAQPASPGLNALLGVDGTSTNGNDVVEKLTAIKSDGTYEIGDEAFVNFLEWHSHALSTAQWEFDLTAAGHKREYVAAFTEAVNEGWVPASAVTHLSRLHKTRLIVDDGFQTHMHGLAGSMVGTSDDQMYRVLVAPAHAEAPHRLLLHELTHVMDGHDDLPEAEKNEMFRLPKSSGLYRLFGAGDGGEAMNEAVVEHFTHSMHRGEVDVLDTTAEIRNGATYTDERYLLNVLANGGFAAINIRTFIAAHFEDQGQAGTLGDQSAQVILAAQLREAFPFADVVGEISRLSTNKDKEAILKYAIALEARVRKHNTISQRIGRKILAKVTSS